MIMAMMMWPTRGGKIMEKITDVADWFLSQNSMTHKKLQKLCYYAQAWYCTLKDENGLFEDEIQAWIHGPVVVSLYPIYADYGWNDIGQKSFCADTLKKESLEILEAVYETYGNFTGDQLESLTHSEEPWIEARRGLKPWEPGNNPITCQAMKNYYGRVFRESQND